MTVIGEIVLLICGIIGLGLFIVGLLIVGSFWWIGKE